MDVTGEMSESPKACMPPGEGGATPYIEPKLNEAESPWTPGAFWRGVTPVSSRLWKGLFGVGHPGVVAARAWHLRSRMPSSAAL